MTGFVVEEVAPASLHDLRRRVLREDRPDANVVDPRDDEATSLHLAGRLDGRVVTSASYFLTPPPDQAGSLGYQMRYVATDAQAQGRGYARRVLARGEELLAQRGVEVIWANARDSALGFYRREGWHLVARSEHVSLESQLPHTRIFKVLG